MTAAHIRRIHIVERNAIVDGPPEWRLLMERLGYQTLADADLVIVIDPDGTCHVLKNRNEHLSIAVTKETL